MMKKGLIALVVILAVGSFALIMLRGQGDSSGNSTQPTEVKLSQDIIDQAIAQCENRTTWGIALADVRINYIAGVGVEGAIVLHNGDDAERLVTLSYQTVSLPQHDSETGDYYQPSPIEASGWVTLDSSQIRLERMDTAVVKIHFSVPRGTKLPARWEFRISAVGAQIDVWEEKLIVATGENDNELTATLTQPLLNNDIMAVLNVTSESPSDILYVKGYNPSTRGLTIGGLADSLERLVTIKYEYPLILRVAYEQRWLIKMI